ncbi:MAG TPA: sulfite exporter TauE/SafE family protein, partial [Clostridia bacterium]|nr:sulfite exporter TauE/SafE family protein [Clostridia bacterium]
IMFISFLGLQDSVYAILGLVIGGIIAAPFGAFLCKRVPMKPLMALVGALVIFLNVKSLIEFFIK